VEQTAGVQSRLLRWLHFGALWSSSPPLTLPLGDCVRAMKSTTFTLAIITFLLSACATSPRVEQTTDLGFGFRRVTLAEPSRSSFESIGHFEYLYFGDRRLDQVAVCSISPSGRYAVYQGGPHNNLFLFRPADGRTTQLTSQFVALVDTFDWHEDVQTVEAHFAAGHGAQTFALP